MENNNKVVRDRLEQAIERQKAFLLQKQIVPVGPAADASPLDISITVKDDIESVLLSNDESYSLSVIEDSGIKVEIVAQTFQGARHGLETLFQLMDWDQERETFLIVDSVQISDSPYYPHRGIMVDTSRNFISVAKIKEVISSLSFSKMNVFHWHLTDSHSFPLLLDSHPEMADYGAYRGDMIYTKEDMREVNRFATER